MYRFSMSSKLKYKLKTMFMVATGGSLVFFGINLCKGDENFYRDVIMPLVHRFTDAETAHRLGVYSIKLLGTLPGNNLKQPSTDLNILKTKLWNLEFANPVGLAAGFDKNGEAVSGLFKIGFGFVEVGSVTPKAQPGNPKPRVFRLIEDKAVINRYGFNSEGHAIVHERLKRTHLLVGNRHILGVNLGKNKTSDEMDDWDYEEGVKKFADVADFLIINVSSPNTPGLRNMQAKASLSRLLDVVLRARKSIGSTVPILVKIAPDLTMDEKKDIINVIVSKGIDGVVISNTTVSRPKTLISTLASETGGLSGEPIKEITTEAIREVYILTKGKVPIIGVGGVSSGKDAYEKIRAGASLVELYTALVYEGPPVVSKIKRELEELLRNDGFRSVSEAVGAYHRKP